MKMREREKIFFSLSLFFTQTEYVSHLNYRNERSASGSFRACVITSGFEIISLRTPQVSAVFPFSFSPHSFFYSFILSFVCLIIILVEFLSSRHQTWGRRKKKLESGDEKEKERVGENLFFFHLFFLGCRKRKQKRMGGTMCYRSLQLHFREPGPGKWVVEPSRRPCKPY